MKNTIKSIKNRLQVPANTKQVQNYCYYPDRVIGSGNYSIVYQAISLTTKQKIAAKVINLKLYTQRKMVELLEQQIQILLTLDHPNIIKCYDVLKTSQECYCFTELCEGGSLAQQIGMKGRLTEFQAWPYIRDIYQGLNYLNSKGVIHRDIKAANIFLKDGVAKIADFGFAVHSRISFRDLNIGSPVYMSPEGYLHNTYGVKTDVWAFGIVIYEMLHGKTPFSHIEDPQVLMKELMVQLRCQDFRQDISADLKELMRSCLQIDEKRRISLAEIQFTPYMQRKLYSKYSVPSGGEKKSLYVPAECLNRYNSSLNSVRIPCRISVKTASNNQNNCQHEEETESSVKEEEKKVAIKKEEDSKIYHFKTNVKVDKELTEPLSALTRYPVRIAATEPRIKVYEPRMKAYESRIKVTQPQVKTIEHKAKICEVRRVAYNRYCERLYQPLSAQLK